jgi:hypothetical protein
VGRSRLRWVEDVGNDLRELNTKGLKQNEIKEKNVNLFKGPRYS